MKKLASLLLVLAMLLTCVGAVAEEPVTITWYGVGGTSDHQDRINAAASKYLQSKGINANLEIVKLGWGDYMNVYQVMAATQEPFDLINAPGNVLMSYGTNGALVEITDEILDGKLPAMKAAISEDVLKSLTYQGKLYVVPAQHEWAQYYGSTYVNVDIAEELGLMEEINAVDSLDDLDPIFEKVHAAYPDVVCFMMGGEPVMTAAKIDTLNHSDSTCVGLDYKAPGTKWFSYFENEEVITVYRKINEWYKKGYINTDTTVADTDLRSQGKTFLQVSRFKPGAAAQATTADARFVDIAWDKDAAPMLGLKDAPSGWGTGVSKTSHNVDVALQVLNAAYEDPNLINLIYFGEEGVDYTVNANGFVEMTEGGYGAGMYTSHCWQYGNQHIGGVTQAYADLGLADIWVQQDAFNKSAVAVEAAGFYFDPTNVDIEIAAVNTVYGEYADLINRGSAEDFDTMMAEFVQKLHDNGLQTIIDEANAQYEAFLAAK